MGNIPADDDAQLTYKDADGAVIIPIAGDSYVDDKKGGIMRKSDDKQVNVFIGDEMIIPKDGEAPIPPVPPEPEKELVNIAWTKAPTKIVYQIGDALELDGAEITATYSDDSTAEVTGQCNFTPANGESLDLDKTVITAEFEGKTATQDITVS